MPMVLMNCLIPDGNGPTRTKSYDFKNLQELKQIVESTNDNLHKG